VGDIPYQSVVTRRPELLPIAVSLIGAPGKFDMRGSSLILTGFLLGTDLILCELVEKGMRAAGLPTEVKTGRSMF
jgi:hypothetical protein